ncbi:MAG TPA: T9SS type A sorting domain-containing protein, partial [Puia sp.]|nr:T9SS type A sorting domain-containing protein [Puia sp.]
PTVPESPTIYYRVRETDRHGSSLYSNIVAVKQSVYYLDLAIAPNPSPGSATLRFRNDRSTVVTIRLLDITGQPAWTRQYPATRGLNTLQLDHLPQLPNGMYIVQMYNGENQQNVKFCIRR